MRSILEELSTVTFAPIPVAESTAYIVELLGGTVVAAGSSLRLRPKNGNQTIPIFYFIYKFF